MMTDEAVTQSLHEQLFSDPDANVFAVLDGASIGRDLVVNLYEREVEFFCLFAGELEPDMAEVAPYVAQLEPESEFTQWVLGKGWGKHWGVFAAASEDIYQMRGHFRGLVDVYDEDGKPLIFRFYDPRVLRAFLPTCNAQELQEVFGPVAAYSMEAEDPAVLLSFATEGGDLRKHEVRLARS